MTVEENKEVTFESLAAEIEAEDAGNPTPAPEKKEEEPAQAEETVEGGEGDAEEEQTEAEDESEQDEEQPEAEEAEALEAKAEKKRSKYIPRDRFDEINGKLSAAERALIEKDVLIDQERKKSEALAAAFKKQFGMDDPAKVEDKQLDEPVDKEHIDALNKRLDTMTEEQQRGSYNNAVASQFQALQATLPDLGNAIEFFKATHALEIITEAKMRGKEITEAQAIQIATDYMDDKGFDVFKEGVNPVVWAYNKAISRGFAPKKTEEKKPVNDDKPKVNMKEVERARKEAGAPTVKKASIDTAKLNWDSIGDEVRREMQPRSA